MKICLAQIHVEPCRPDLNYAIMTNAIVQAKSQKADMIVFPELCIPGYLIGDTWEEEAYLRDCITYGEQIREMADEIVVVSSVPPIILERRCFFVLCIVETRSAPSSIVMLGFDSSTVLMWL